MPDPPFFLPPPLLNKHMRKDLTPEERQLVLDYGLRNLQKGPDGGGGRNRWSAHFSAWNR